MVGGIDNAWTPLHYSGATQKQTSPLKEIPCAHFVVLLIGGWGPVIVQNAVQQRQHCQPICQRNAPAVEQDQSKALQQSAGDTQTLDCSC